MENLHRESAALKMEEEIHLRNYITVLYKRRYVALTIFIIVFTVTLIGTLSTEPLYMASAKLLVEKAEPRSLTMNYGYNYDPEFYQTQYELIRSVSVGRKVVDMLNLDRTYDSYFKSDTKTFSLTGGLADWARGLFSTGSGVTGSKEQVAADQHKDEMDSRADTIARVISGGIIVKPVKNSKIVDVSYMSTNPEFAKNVVNAIAKAYIEEILELNMSSTRYTLEWMTKKAAEERERLEKSEKALQQYMKNQNFVTLENKVAIIPQKMSELNSQLTRAEAKKKEMETLYNKVKEISENLEEAETISVIASDPTFQSLRQQILRAEQNMMDLSRKYGKKHPAMMRVVEDVNVLKTKKEQEIKRIIESVKNEYELARANESNLRRMLAETKGEAINVNEKFIEYGAINRDVETNKQLYDALIKKMKEESITERVQTVNIMIVEKADTPKYPVKPRKAINLLIGLVIGLFGGIGMAFFVEYLDNTVRSPEDAETKLGVPVFGMVPLVASQEKPIEHMVLDEPKSNFAESYKAIRTALLLSSAERPPKRILITSAGPGEGKTTTAVNLALAIALSENRVLLIDADLRKPRVHKIFGLGNEKGLSTYLSGASDMDIVQGGPLSNLGVITSGPVPPNPSELLSSNRLSELISDLSGKYDIIIIDSPPLLTVADTLILSKIPDGTIVVARAGKTTYEAARKGLKSLANLDAHVLGIVINAVDIRKGDYYYYRYQSYYYSSEEMKE